MEAKEILLAEDDSRDIELTLAALEEHNLANKVVIARDGALALDYLYRRGEYADLHHQIIQLLWSYPWEAGVGERCALGRLLEGLLEREDGGGIADAPPQVVAWICVECYKDTAPVVELLGQLELL